ncbi:MAG: ATP-binding cassette domain-containing protein [Oscillospiraceae bacterium]|jgi:putative ABC transport system ATP-binding protein|nr:ATP-binding cassette domain-containing protein [Oscillospiraceae bacterium]
MQKPDKPRVRLEGVEKTFAPGTANENELFQNFNLTIHAGEFVSVVGSNGSGKTTLLNLLCGSLRPDKGRVEVDGKAVDRLGEHQRAAVIGRVFQNPAAGTCASLTIMENLSLADHKGKAYGLSGGVNKGRTNAYRALLEPLGLGLENQLGMPVGNLSGGQRQALALLISTLSPVDLLVLDEHTAALDPRSSETVMKLTERLVREKHLTTLMVTHNLRYAAEYGDRLLMMHRGQVTLDVAGDEKRALGAKELARRFQEAEWG